MSDVVISANQSIKYIGAAGVTATSAGASGATTGTFTVPSGNFFKGQLFIETLVAGAGSTDCHVRVRLNNGTGVILGVASFPGQSTNNSGTLGALVNIELPAGTYVAQSIVGTATSNHSFGCYGSLYSNSP